MAKKRGGAHGGHGWFVTFADLMGLLMSFFVMLVAFSTQDKQKLQIVAGSMRDAFGVQPVRYSGIVETDGLPTRPSVRNTARINPEDASANPGPNDFDRQKEGLRLKEDKSFALAAASANDLSSFSRRPSFWRSKSFGPGLAEASSGLMRAVFLTDGRVGNPSVSTMPL